MKKEKYITEIQNKDGTTSFRVAIKYYDLSGKRLTAVTTINSIDYPTMSDALLSACIERDKMLLDSHNRRLYAVYPTIEYLYEKVQTLFPGSLKTQRNHAHFYKYGIKLYETMTIDKVTAATVQESINKYAETHTTNQTSHLLSVWRMIFKSALLSGFEVTDKTQLVTIPKSKIVSKVKPVTISDHDLDLFCDALLNYHIYDEKGRYTTKSIWYLIQVLYYTGLRPAEAMALTREDIQNGRIVINKAVGSDLNKCGVIIPTKTKQSARSVPVALRLLPVLQDLKDFTDRDYLFTDYDGKLYEINYVSNLITIVSKSCGIKFNLYMLRHRFASDLVKEQTSPRVVQDLMGHANFSMSLDYARSSEEDRKDAVDKRKLS